MIVVVKQYDMSCTHEKYCRQWCIDRVYRQCHRLADAFRLVYDDTTVAGEQTLQLNRSFSAGRLQK